MVLESPRCQLLMGKGSVLVLPAEREPGRLEETKRISPAYSQQLLNSRSMVRPGRGTYNLPSRIQQISRLGLLT